jgi:hypothetical protein
VKGLAPRDGIRTAGQAMNALTPDLFTNSSSDNKVDYNFTINKEMAL